MSPLAKQYVSHLVRHDVAQDGIPGMVWHDDLLWMSYYSSHEGRTSIYLAKIRFEQPESRAGLGSKVRCKSRLTLGQMRANRRDSRFSRSSSVIAWLKVKFPSGRPITVIAQPRFAEVRDLRLAELLEASPALVLEAAM